MTCPTIRRLLTIAWCVLLSLGAIAQSENESKKENKPYRIQTSGKQVTVKSSKSIKNIMVWTASGHRIVEQRDLKLTSYSFTANTKDRVYFVMIQYEGLKPYTEKIGVDK